MANRACCANNEREKMNVFESLDILERIIKIAQKNVEGTMSAEVAMSEITGELMKVKVNN